MYVRIRVSVGTEAYVKNRKMLLLETGIFRHLGLNIAEILVEEDFNTINKGAIAEQYTGLEILKSSSCYKQENWAGRAGE